MSRNQFVDTGSSVSSQDDLSAGSNSTNDPVWLPAKAQSNSSSTTVESSSSQPNFNLSLPLGFENEDPDELKSERSDNDDLILMSEDDKDEKEEKVSSESEKKKGKNRNEKSKSKKIVPEEFEEALTLPEGFGEDLTEKDMNVVEVVDVEVVDVFQEPDFPEAEEENGNNRLDERNVIFDDPGDYIEAAQPNQTKKATSYAVKTFNDVILQYSGLKKVPYISLKETPVEQLSKRLSTFFMVAKKSNGEVIFFIYKLFNNLSKDR